MINIGMILDSYKGNKDKSVRLSFGTQEAVGANKELIAEIISLQGKYLQVAIIERDEPLKEEEIPDIKISTHKAKKSLSKQLRDRLYVLWDKSPKKAGMVSYDTFYERYMMMRLDKIQEQIDSLE